ncbi:DUF1127 domain-containing protein [Variovorax sp. ZT4R33]|uniref:DUF1127 domain-containing protein n=1 Tax=Variovorax sp. ZT4R33 TaxID=3443743 RepID=UPI003F46D019
MTRSPTVASTPWFATLRRWIGRLCGTGTASADARDLRGMSDHELKDLGIGRSEIQEWSRRRAPTDHPGTRERAPLRGSAEGRCDSVRADAEHRQHDGRQRQGDRLLASGQCTGLRSRQPAGMEHVFLGMKGSGHMNS